MFDIPRRDRTVDQIKSLNQEWIQAVKEGPLDEGIDCLHAPYDHEQLAFIKHKAHYYLAKKNIHTVFVIGIGGSHLSIQAVEQFLRGTLPLRQSPAFFYIDTVDADQLYEIQLHVQGLIQKNLHFVCLIISKSGCTFETVINATIFFQAFNLSMIKEHTICITEKYSPLEQWARENLIEVLYIPEEVGGRFSIFTVVGLFPLALAGIDIEALCQGARGYDVVTDHAGKRALYLYHAIKKKIPIHDLFIFSPDAHALGLWYRQLMAETLGKDEDRFGNRKINGIMPTISIGTSDLHSVGQLYLAGPRTRITTFLTVQTTQDIPIQTNGLWAGHEYEFKNFTAYDVMRIASIATMETYKKEKKHFMHIHIPQKNAYFVGQYMFMSLLEILYTAQLLEINPYDQPAVEKFKSEIKQQMHKFAKK